MRVFFATDIHGSEICWRKFLNAASFYKADAVILGGDVTGKVMVRKLRPLEATAIADRERKYQATLAAKKDDGGDVELFD